MSTAGDASLFYALVLPPAWQAKRRDASPILEAFAPDGGRMVVTARSISAFNAEQKMRRKTLTLDLERSHVKAVAMSDGTLGGEPALVAQYPHGGQVHFQLSAVKDGIEYRVSLTAASEAQRREVLAALEGGFQFPDAAVAAEVAPALPPSRNAHEAALLSVRQAATATREALPGGGAAGSPAAMPKPRRRRR